MNMSANILRNIVAATFKINSTAVKLSGEISPEFKVQNQYFNGSMGENHTIYNVWGWCPENGFVKIHECIGEQSGSNYAHSSSIDEEGTELYCIEGIEKYIFFVISKEVYSNWEGSQYENYTKWELFKAPDFAAKLAAVEKAEIERWEEWIK